MNHSKQLQMQALIKLLRQDTTLDKLIVNRKGQSIDVGLINHYKLHELIPNKWFDWERRVDAPIMIIGQDWGPYSALFKYIEDYQIQKDTPDFNYDDFLFKALSSRTEKFIINSLTKNYFEIFNKQISKKDWDLFFFTVAVLLTRQGHLFRGNNNFEPKASSQHSYPYVVKQIEIVQPKIIMPLGGMAWDVLAKYFNLQNLGKNITQVVTNLPDSKYIKINNTYIVPNFHPASYVNPKIIDRQFKQIWEIVKHERIL